MPSRMETRFAELKAANRGGLVTFVTAGDPDPETSFAILRGLPAAGADLIEIGMPFSDPMADGPAIQASSLDVAIGSYPILDGHRWWTKVVVRGADALRVASVASSIRAAFTAPR